jgi:hypothetical protein
VLGLRVDGFLVDASHAAEPEHDQQGDAEPALVEADVDAEDTTKPDVDRQGSPLLLHALSPHQGGIRGGCFPGVRYHRSVVCSALVSARSKIANPSSTSGRAMFSAGTIRTTDRPQLSTKRPCSKARYSTA